MFALEQSAVVDQHGAGGVGIEVEVRHVLDGDGAGLDLGVIVGPAAAARLERRGGGEHRAAARRLVGPGGALARQTRLVLCLGPTFDPHRHHRLPLQLLARREAALQASLPRPCAGERASALAAAREAAEERRAEERGARASALRRKKLDALETRQLWELAAHYCNGTVLDKPDWEDADVEEFDHDDDAASEEEKAANASFGAAMMDAILTAVMDDEAPLAPPDNWKHRPEVQLQFFKDLDI